MNKIMTLAVLIGLTVVAAPLIASAQCIEVTPENWDYGDVKVGTGQYNAVMSDNKVFLIKHDKGKNKCGEHGGHQTETCRRKH